MKEQITEILIARGYEQDGNMFIRAVRVPIGTIVANGVESTQFAKAKIVIEYLGEGEDVSNEGESRKITSWNVLINDADMGAFLVYDIEDFKFFLSKLL